MNTLATTVYDILRICITFTPLFHYIFKFYIMASVYTRHTDKLVAIVNEFSSIDYLLTTKEYISRDAHKKPSCR